VDSSTFGTKMPRAEWSFIGNVFISVPSINTQQQIINHIKEETAKIDEVIIRTEKEIELIKEYRQSIIAEVVTGKIKVAN
jgi:restriction endonuclease S subunit